MKQFCDTSPELIHYNGFSPEDTKVLLPEVQKHSKWISGTLD